MAEKTKSAGVFIPDITVEMLKKAPIEAIEGLLSEGEILDIDIEEIKESAYQRGLGQNKWIPVSKRLPETHTEYAGEDAYQISDAVLGYGRLEHYNEGDPMMAVVWYEDDCDGRTGWYVAPDCFNEIEVLAWQPLPEPHKESETE